VLDTANLLGNATIEDGLFGSLDDLLDAGGKLWLPFPPIQLPDVLTNFASYLFVGKLPVSNELRRLSCAV